MWRNQQINIFILDENPVTAAHMHCDKHVVKMLLESAQMLSTAHRVLDGTEYMEQSSSGKRKIKRWKHPNDEYDAALYKAVHVNHPCTVWTRATIGNYIWHYSLFRQLCVEYTYRYGKTHKTETQLLELLRKTPTNISVEVTTPYAKAVPEMLKNLPAVEAYRRYYQAEKAEFAVWTKVDKPGWWDEIS